MRIGICDDQQMFLEETKNILAKWENRPLIFSVDTFSDGDCLLEAHSKQPFDVIFLDIVMPIFNGMEIAREIRATDASVKLIFLTSSPDFAVESYTVKANNYLLKPIRSETLYKIMDEMLQELATQSTYITIRSLDAVHHIDVATITHVESQGKHLLFYLTDGRRLEATASLYTYETILTQQDGFFRCHRSYIVNIYHIASFTAKDIRMNSGALIPISRNVKKVFEELYFSLIFEKAGVVL